MNDKELAAGFITGFFNDVENLKDIYSNYLNNCIQINSKRQIGQQETEEDRITLLQAGQALRAWATRAYISFSSLTNKMQIKKETVTQVNELYQHISQTANPEPSKALDFITQLNTLFVENILSDALDKANNTFK